MKTATAILLKEIMPSIEEELLLLHLDPRLKESLNIYYPTALKYSKEQNCPIRGKLLKVLCAYTISLNTKLAALINTTKTANSNKVKELLLSCPEYSFSPNIRWPSKHNPRAGLTSYSQATNSSGTTALTHYAHTFAVSYTLISQFTFLHRNPIYIQHKPVTILDLIFAFTKDLQKPLHTALAHYTHTIGDLKRAVEWLEKAIETAKTL